MELSDLLAILDIVVTVVIGFVITHMVSVRDSRTRAIKDYYIQELAAIKSEINNFYASLFKGELEAKEIIGWYSAIRNRIDSFDKAVRKTFTIYEGSITKKLFLNYKYITNSNEFNSNYYQGKINFRAATKNAIGKNEKQLYMLVERTLYDINNVRARDYIERKWLELKSHYLYYRTTERKSRHGACLNILWAWLCTHKSIVVFWAFLAIIVCFFFQNIGKVLKQDNDNSAQLELIERFDTLNSIVKDVSNRIDKEPVFVESPSTYSIRLKEISSKDTTNLKGWIRAFK